MPFTPCLLSLTFAAQTPDLDDLRDADWRVRNEAARALAALPAERLDIERLLAVMCNEPGGDEPGFALFGGPGGRWQRQRDPRERIRVEAMYATMATGSWWHRAAPRVSGVDDLVVPWHPRALAGWLIEERTSPGCRPGLVLALEDEHLARVWLWLGAPAGDVVRRALADPVSGRIVAQALEDLSRHEALDDALAAADSGTRRNVLAVLGSRGIETRDGLAAAVEIVLQDVDAAAVAHVGSLVERADGGVAMLVDALGTVGADRRALQRGLTLLCDVEDSSVGHALALDHIGDDDASVRHLALYVLGRQPLPPELRADAAARLLRIVEGRTDRDTRLLAFDALGRCGDGVDDAQRLRLIEMLEHPPAPGVEARVLGCLRTLGDAARVPLELRLHVATTGFPTTATWLALADAGGRAVEVLADLLVTRVPGVDAAAVAGRLARTAPDALRAWLSGDEPRLRELAMAALRSIEPDSGIRTAQLLELLETAPWHETVLVDWLADRGDVADGAARVFAWMAARGEVRIPPAWVRFAAQNRLPTQRMLELLDPLLGRGLGWELLGDGDRDVLRAACAARFARTTDPEARTRIAAAVARLGAASDDDVDLVLDGLSAGDPDAVLLALEKSPRLPPRVRTRVEELLEADASFTRHLAREALLVRRSGR
jgi:hypothetical protein